MEEFLLSTPINPNNFPAKLWRIVNSPRYRSIRWDPRGEGLIVDQQLFESELLAPIKNISNGAKLEPNTDLLFKTTNFTSFIRQLNLYGFRKLGQGSSEHPVPGELGAGDGLLHHFHNPSFKQDHPELLINMKRLTSANKAKLAAGLQVNTRPPNRFQRYLTNSMDSIGQTKGDRHAPIVLGYPWLSRHNPHIDWSTRKMVSWSSFCHSTCLQSALSAVEVTTTSSASETTPPNLSKVPAEYHNLGKVFSKQRALSLPPHCPYNCAIDLLLGAPLPTSRLYNQSGPEREAMETYLNDSLVVGIIQPSSSPVGAGFFFVGKKDSSLRPCIGYCGPNSITIMNKYPLPLINSTFKPLHGATIFSKLDLRSAHHLVRIREGDEWKTAFNTPLGHFEYLVMPFGLTNAPTVLQALVNDVLRDFINRFIFVYLDDILISRSLQEHTHHVRQVLQSLLENKLFVKAEKCKFHVPSVSFLEYIIESGQVRADPEKIWAVAEFPLTYRPGSKNGKSNALSHQYISEEGLPNPEPILPPSCEVAALTWEIESIVKKAQRTQPHPGPVTVGQLQRTFRRDNLSPYPFLSSTHNQSSNPGGLDRTPIPPRTWHSSIGLMAGQIDTTSSSPFSDKAIPFSVIQRFPTEVTYSLQPNPNSVHVQGSQEIGSAGQKYTSYLTSPSQYHQAFYPTAVLQCCTPNSHLDPLAGCPNTNASSYPNYNYYQNATMQSSYLVDILHSNAAHWDCTATDESKISEVNLGTVFQIVDELRASPTLQMVKMDDAENAIQMQESQNTQQTPSSPTFTENAGANMQPMEIQTLTTAVSEIKSFVVAAADEPLSCSLPAVADSVLTTMSKLSENTTTVSIVPEPVASDQCLTQDEVHKLCHNTSLHSIMFVEDGTQSISETTVHGTNYHTGSLDPVQTSDRSRTIISALLSDFDLPKDTVTANTRQQNSGQQAKSPDLHLLVDVACNQDHFQKEEDICVWETEASHSPQLSP
ncbi:heat shock factor protein 5-like [Hypanus sabinus]|uniref:heat shock factor protein 5-like n=1 Tax=Hypanus sabinus TaxID=79690 RepID=UPI0028C38474|nr:heat shock factor protein 5-like [Hypanus sabinus]